MCAIRHKIIFHSFKLKHSIQHAMVVFAFRVLRNLLYTRSKTKRKYEDPLLLKNQYWSQEIYILILRCFTLLIIHYLVLFMMFKKKN